MDPDTIRRNSERAQAATSRLPPLLMRKYGISNVTSHPDRDQPALTFTATRNPATSAPANVAGSLTIHPTQPLVLLRVGDEHNGVSREVREDAWPHALTTALDYLLAG